MRRIQRNKKTIETSLKNDKYRLSMDMRVVVVCPPRLQDQVFPQEVLAAIGKTADLLFPVVDPDCWLQASERLHEADTILSTWGMPALTPDFLEAAPELKAVFYAAGTVKSFVTEAAWDRGITICSAWEANGVPVSEYSLGVILLSLKRFWHFAHGMRSPDPDFAGMRVPGAYRSEVGLVSLGAVGRATARLLRPFDVSILAYDPFANPEDAAELGVELVSLADLFSRSEVVSLHAPWIRETERLITGSLIASMKEGATLINTSRGAIIAEDEMIEVLRHRPDISVVLDVTHPEPPAASSPLRFLPNVILTPHIAGSIQRECTRMGQRMVAELQRYITGLPLQHRVTREMLAGMA